MVQTQAPRESPAFSLGVWPIVLLGPSDQTQNTNAMYIVHLCFACMHSTLLCIVKTGYYWRILQEYLTFKFTTCRCWDCVDCSLKYLSVWELLGKHVAWSSQCRAVAFSFQIHSGKRIICAMVPGIKDNSWQLEILQLFYAKHWYYQWGVSFFNLFLMVVGEPDKPMRTSNNREF